MCRFSRSDSGTLKTASSQPSSSRAARPLEDPLGRPRARISRACAESAYPAVPSTRSRTQDPAPLEPGDRRRGRPARRRRARPSAGSARPRRASRRPRARKAVERDDERARLRGGPQVDATLGRASSRRHDSAGTSTADRDSGPLTAVTRRAILPDEPCSSRRRRTSTPSAATTCRRSTSGPSCSSTCRSCSTRIGSTARPSCWTRRSPRHGAGPALRPRRRPRRGPTATCCAVRTRSRTCSSTTSAWCPATGCCCGARTTRWLVACWFGVLKAGGVVVTTMPLLRAGELRTVAEIAAIDLALCDHRFLDDLSRPALGACAIVAYGGGRPRRPRAAADGPARFDDVDDRRRRRRAAGVHLGHDRAAQGDHALPPRRPRHRRHVLPARAASRPPTTSSPARRRWRSRSASAACVVFPLRAGASTLLVEKATPDELADLIAEHRVDRLLHRADGVPRDARRPAERDQLSSLRRVRVGRRAPAGGDLAGVPRGDRRQASSTASAPPRCCTSSSRPPTTTSGPGSTGGPVPGYVAAVLDDDGRAGAGRRRSAGWRCKGPTGCRYLADDRQQRLRPARLEHHRRHLRAATRTATSGSRPAATT